jgi:hypothetical protein
MSDAATVLLSGTCASPALMSGVSERIIELETPIKSMLALSSGGKTLISRY